MDTVTHSLVGAAVSDAWFRKRLGPVATPFALVVSALPDADILAYFVSRESAWTQHRGYTHSFFVQLLAAPLIGLAAYFIAKGRGRWVEWSGLALICLWGHTVFDLITSWGTMPLLPFSNARISWDVVPILDIFLTSVTAASFVANRILRWERIQTFLNPLAFPIVYRHPRRQRAADIVAVVAVALVATYLLVGWLQNRQTIRIAARELAAAGVEAVEIRALPIMFTYLSWDVVARDGDGVIYQAPYSSYAPGPMRFTAYASQDNPSVRQAVASPQGRMFAWYSQNMYTADSHSGPNGEVVVMRDRRFFSPRNPGQSRFVMEFAEDASGNIVSVQSRQVGMDAMNLRDELYGYWGLTIHGDPEWRPEAGEFPARD